MRVWITIELSLLCFHRGFGKQGFQCQGKTHKTNMWLLCSLCLCYVNIIWIIAFRVFLTRSMLFESHQLCCICKAGMRKWQQAAWLTDLCVSVSLVASSVVFFFWQEASKIVKDNMAGLRTNWSLWSFKVYFHLPHDLFSNLQAWHYILPTVGVELLW